jgi:hypothetical protein
MAHPQTQNGHPQAPPAEAARRARRPQGRTRVLTNPQDVMALVLRQVDAVNATKDKLIIALKRLMDITKQLARAYAAQAQAIQTLQGRVKALEEKATQKINVASGNGPIFSTRDSDAGTD